MSVVKIQRAAREAELEIYNMELSSNDIAFLCLTSNLERPRYRSGCFKLPTRAELEAFSPTYWTAQELAEWRAYVARGGIKPAGYGSRDGIFALGLAQEPDLYDSKLVGAAKALCDQYNLAGYE